MASRNMPQLFGGASMRRDFCRLILWPLLCGALPLHARPSTVTYIYTDPQGTPLAEANSSGNITATFDYQPYGSLALGSAPSGPGYTGHVNDPDTGLVYMQARYYDSVIGRFMSRDPAGINAGQIHSFGRYAYANGNPIVNVDPDGRVVTSANVANNTKIQNWINSRSSAQYAYVDGKLTKVADTSNGGGKSKYFSDRLDKAIASSQTIVVDVGDTTNDLKSVDAHWGGGLTSKAEPDKPVNIIVSETVTTTSGANGTTIVVGPEDRLPHEIVSHALPLIGYPDTGNAVDDENKVRSENGLREREPSDEREMERHFTPKDPTCGILCG